VFISCSKVTFHSEPVNNYYSLIKKTIKAWNIQTIQFSLLSFSLLSSVILSSVPRSWSLLITLHSSPVGQLAKKSSFLWIRGHQ